MADTTFAKLLDTRSKADQVFRLTCELTNLHAVQGRNDGETQLSHVAINQTTDTMHQEGIPSGEAATPVRRRRGQTQTKAKMVQTYQFERNGKPDIVLVEIGGPYGLLAKTLRDAVVAKEKAKYWLPSLALIKFTTVKGMTQTYIEVKAATTINALDTGDKPMPRMEPRNTRGAGGRTMVPVFHERIPKPIAFPAEMIVNAECPRTAEEIAGLLHAMQAVPCGPAKRGQLRILKVERMG